LACPPDDSHTYSGPIDLAGCFISLNGPAHEETFSFAITNESYPMGKKLFVGGLAKSVSEEDLRELLATHGDVDEANVVYDRYTGQSRGFGFASFFNDEEADAAIAQLNGQEFQGNRLTVNEARPREERPQRDFGGGGGGRGGGGGYGGGGGGGGKRRGGGGGGRKSY